MLSWQNSGERERPEIWRRLNGIFYHFIIAYHHHYYSPFTAGDSTLHSLSPHSYTLFGQTDQTVYARRDNKTLNVYTCRLASAWSDLSLKLLRICLTLYIDWLLIKPLFSRFFLSSSHDSSYHVSSIGVDSDCADERWMCVPCVSAEKEWSEEIDESWQVQSWARAADDDFAICRICLIIHHVIPIFENSIAKKSNVKCESDMTSSSPASTKEMSLNSNFLSTSLKTKSEQEDFNESHTRAARGEWNVRYELRYCPTGCRRGVEKKNKMEIFTMSTSTEWTQPESEWVREENRPKAQTKNSSFSAEATHHGARVSERRSTSIRKKMCCVFIRESMIFFLCSTNFTHCMTHHTKRFNGIPHMKWFDLFACALSEVSRSVERVRASGRFDSWIFFSYFFKYE